MERKLKVYPSQIEDYLKENGDPVPVQEIADAFDCTKATIRKRLRTLRRQGRKIAPTKKGVYLIGKVDGDNAPLILQSARWVISVVKVSAEIGHVLRLPFAEAKRLLKGSEDRKELKQMSLGLVRLVDAVDVEEEFGEE